MQRLHYAKAVGLEGVDLTEIRDRQNEVVEVVDQCRQLKVRTGFDKDRLGRYFTFIRKGGVSSAEHIVPAVCKNRCARRLDLNIFCLRRAS